MKKHLITIILVFLCFILQSTVFHAISFAGIVPNLLMILTASCGFLNGERDGILYGLLCGLLMDLFFGSVIGLYSLIYMYVGFLNGKFVRILYPDDIKLALVLISASDLAYGLFCYLILFLLRGRFHFGYYFIHLIIPEILYTLLVSLLLYPFVLWIHNHFDNTNKKGSIKDIA